VIPLDRPRVQGVGANVCPATKQAPCRATRAGWRSNSTSGIKRLRERCWIRLDARRRATPAFS